MTTRWFKLAILSILCIASNAKAFEMIDSFLECYVTLREDSLRWKLKDNCTQNPVILDESCFDAVKMFGKASTAKSLSAITLP